MSKSYVRRTVTTPFPRNYPLSRTLPAFLLHPSGNAQGRYVFLSLSANHLLVRHQWSSIPMPPSVVARVHSLATQERVPPLNKLVFSSFSFPALDEGASQGLPDSFDDTDTESITSDASDDDDTNSSHDHHNHDDQGDSVSVSAPDIKIIQRSTKQANV